MKCPVCGEQNIEEAKFCKGCGTPLTASQPVSADANGDAEPAQEQDAPQQATANEPAPAEPQPAASKPSPVEQQPAAQGPTPTQAQPAAYEPAPAQPQPAASEPSATQEQSYASPVASGPASYETPHTGEPAAATGNDPKQMATDLLAKVKALPKKTLAIAGGVAAAVVVILVAFLIMGGGPGKSKVEQDIREAVTTSYSGGSYGADGELSVDSVSITSEEKEAIPEGWGDLLGVSGDAYSYTAEVKVSNDNVEGTETYEATYVKSGNDWEALTGPSRESHTYSAKSGPSSDKVIENISSILSEASSGSSNYASSLSNLYAKGSFEVTSNDWSGTSASMVIHGTTETTFSKSEGDITATFTFDTSSGAWKLSEAKASSDMATVDYSKLVGTWTGTFQKTYASSGSQSDIYGGKCYGAQSQNFTLKITSVDKDSLKVEGTFSGLAHYHTGGSSDQNSIEGDTMVNDQAFVATLKTGIYENVLGYFNTINLDLGTTYTTPEKEDGSTLELIFGFGTEDDSNGASAVLKTTYPFEYALGNSNWDTNYYASDVYTLTKNE